MKNYFILLLFVSLMPFISNAQVLEDTVVMCLGSNPALTILIPDAEAKFVDAEWKEFMKPFGKVTKVKQSRETVASHVQILDIGGANEISVYNLNDEATGGVLSTIWIDLGSGYVNSASTPKEYVASVKLLKDFADKVKVDRIANELTEEQKQLEKFESNLTKLQRERDSLNKIIEDSKKRISQAEADIEKNKKDQELAQKEIDSQKGVVSGVQKKLDAAKNQ
jgi:hypothetical protein